MVRASDTHTRAGLLAYIVRSALLLWLVFGAPLRCAVTQRGVMRVLVMGACGFIDSHRLVESQRARTLGIRGDGSADAVIAHDVRGYLAREGADA
jgi:hypothetical protein